MHQTKKGNEWKFGMKCHIGVDAGSGLVHTITVTAANAHDITQAAALIREDDEVVYGDSGYLGIQKRPEVTSDAHLSSIDYRINRRPGKLPHVSDNAIDWERYIENRKSSVRCKVEHAFRIIKCQFGYKKTVYRGLMKNENRSLKCPAHRDDTFQKNPLTCVVLHSIFSTSILSKYAASRQFCQRHLMYVKTLNMLTDNILLLATTCSDNFNRDINSKLSCR